MAATGCLQQKVVARKLQNGVNERSNLTEVIFDLTHTHPSIPFSPVDSTEWQDNPNINTVSIGTSSRQLVGVKFVLYLTIKRWQV